MEQKILSFDLLGEFQQTFRKDVAYDNDTSHKKLGFHSFSRKHTLGKPQGGQINPLSSSFRIAKNIDDELKMFCSIDHI